MANDDHLKALWVYAHPARPSLNHHLMTAGTSALAEQGDVVVSDLYAQRWQPVLSTDDLGDATTSSELTFGAATKAAYAAGMLPPDVQREQARLRDADLLVLQFPLWWFGMPAILKGWFDRVFVNGFAFGVKDPVTGRTMKYGEGGLSGLRALVITTAGDRATSFGHRGVNGDIESLLFPLIHGTLWYTGIAPLRPHVIAATDTPGWRGHDEERERLVRRLRGVAAEPAIPFRHMRGGDYDGDRILRPDLAPGRTDLAVHVAS